MKSLVYAALIFFSLFIQASPEKPRVIFLGDSLTEGYGVEKEDSYPVLIEKRLKKDGQPAEIINTSVSGSTTASAVSRLKWHLKNKPDLVVLALGSNDGLRGLKVEAMKKNLSDAIKLAKDNKIEVLLVGMKIPPNYGKTYASDFEKVFVELAKENKIPLINFLLEGVGGEKKLNQEDGIHPNEKGHLKMADTVYPTLLKVLKSLK